MSGNSDTEKVVAEAAAFANQFLFDENGKPRGYDDYLTQLTFRTVLRPAKPDQKPRLQLIYKAKLAETYIHHANHGDEVAAMVLCNAAALFLQQTGTIPHAPLREFAIGKLVGKIEHPRQRGRNSSENKLRNATIVGRLIPHLLKQGFSATRSEATTDTDSACSILSKALKRLDIDLSEKTISGIWTKHRPHVLNK